MSQALSDLSAAELEALIKQKEETEAAIVTGSAFSRLMSNPDFKKVILDGFCRDESARYAHVSGNPRIPEDQREQALVFARAGGALLEWIVMNQTSIDRLPVKLEVLIEEIAQFNAEINGTDTDGSEVE